MRRVGAAAYALLSSAPGALCFQVSYTHISGEARQFGESTGAAQTQWIVRHCFTCAVLFCVASVTKLQKALTLKEKVDVVDYSESISASKDAIKGMRSQSEIGHHRPGYRIF